VVVVASNVVPSNIVVGGAVVGGAVVVGIVAALEALVGAAGTVFGSLSASVADRASEEHAAARQAATSSAVARRATKWLTRE